jgi:hypothetical protein
VTNNTTGIAGIAPNARLLPVKVLDNRGVGTHIDVAEGIIYATNMGARIINIGFAGRGNSSVLRNAITYALSRNVIIIAPSGNDSGTVNNYPASYPSVVSVGAVNNAGTVAPTSTRSSFLSLTAPGVSIVSTGRGNTYLTASGTSLAAAHVSGVAAMLAGQPQFINQPGLLLTALFATAQDRGTAGRDPVYGYGVMQANNAANYIITTATVKINSPADSSVFAQGATVAFAGVAFDAFGNNITPTLVWASNIDGQIGTGASFSISRLTPGAHTITASVTGGSATVNIRVLEDSGPHGLYTIDTSTCATCHSSHADNGLDYASAMASNDFCISCHNGSRAKAVSTHSNRANDPQGFELLCLQCHDPHGSTNLFAIRQHLVVGELPTRFHSMIPQPAETTFTILNFSTMEGFCSSCHDVPTHAASQICISCHYHDGDGNPFTKDGFMPAQAMAVTMVAVSSPTPLATPTTTLTQSVTATATSTPAMSPTPTLTASPTSTPTSIASPAP